jgi:hypothetical protein
MDKNNNKSSHLVCDEIKSKGRVNFDFPFWT